MALPTLSCKAVSSSCGYWLDCGMSLLTFTASSTLLDTGKPSQSAMPPTRISTTQCRRSSTSRTLRDRPDSLELWTGETGWPTTGGSNYGAAIASTANAATFWREGVCGMRSWGVNVFYFEAFDEPWKPLSVGDNGQSEDETHWGAMTADRQTKFLLTC